MLGREFGGEAPQMHSADRPSRRAKNATVEPNRIGETVALDTTQAKSSWPLLINPVAWLLNRYREPPPWRFRRNSTNASMSSFVRIPLVSGILDFFPIV